MKKFIISLFLLTAFLGGQKTFAVEEVVSLDEVEQPKVEETADIIQAAEKPIEAAVSFDWLDISVAQRESNIEKYRSLLFENKSSKVYFQKEEFKNKFAKYYKDREYKHHYLLVNNGVTEDEDAKYCAFYYAKNTLVMYAIQYKNNVHNSFYYTAFGKLYYTDITSDEYPNFPYYSMQYNRNGKLKSAIYFVSHDIQYMFGPDKEFQGIWYKEKMYDKNGKQTLTRSNW